MKKSVKTTKNGIRINNTNNVNKTSNPDEFFGNITKSPGVFRAKPQDIGSKSPMYNRLTGSGKQNKYIIILSKRFIDFFGEDDKKSNNNNGLFIKNTKQSDSTSNLRDYLNQSVGATQVTSGGNLNTSYLTTKSKGKPEKSQSKLLKHIETFS